MNSSTASFLFRVAIFCFLGAISCRANSVDETERKDWTLSFYFENDLFLNTDKYYTNGTKFSLISPNLHKSFNDTRLIPGWLQPVVQRLPFINDKGIQKNVVISIGQNIYTPEDIRETALIPDDRPYAGWLYLGLGLHNKTDRWLDTLELDVGVVGPWSLGEDTQNFVHRTRDIPEALGWDNQIHNEIGINLIWERKRRVDLFGGPRGFGGDMIYHGGVSLGNVFTYGNAGAAFRFGWNVPSDFGAALIRFAGDTNAPASSADLRLEEGIGFGLHVFAGFDSRLMLRDITLDGNTFKDSHSVEREWWVTDFTVGASALLANWKFSYAYSYRTKTFENGVDHSFGSINISVTF